MRQNGDLRNGERVVMREATEYRQVSGRTSDTRGDRRRGLGRGNNQVEKCEGGLSGGLGQANVIKSACLGRAAGFAVASAHVVTVVEQ